MRANRQQQEQQQRRWEARLRITAEAAKLYQLKVSLTSERYIQTDTRVPLLCASADDNTIRFSPLNRNAESKPASESERAENAFVLVDNRKCFCLISADDKHRDLYCEKRSTGWR